MAGSDPRELLYAYQKRHVENPARFTWCNWSRQIGKSHASSLRRILRGMVGKRNQIFLSASALQSRELMMKAQQHLRAMRIAASAVTEGEEEWFEDVKFKALEMVIPECGPGGAPLRIIGLPANPRTVRGFTGDLLLDEFAMHMFDRDIWAAAFPSVSRSAGEVDVCSTPKGRQNLFYALRENDLFSHSTVTIHEAIAEGCPMDAEELRRGIHDEEKWRQEYLCEFVDEATAFLTYEQICECEKQDLAVELDLDELRTEKRDIVVGIDVGRRRDFTIIWAFAVRERVMESLGLIALSGMPFSEQFEWASNVLCQRGVRRAAIDESGLGMEMAERLEQRFGSHTVERCTLTAPFKEQIANRMRNRFTDKLIRIPVEERIRNDLHSVRRIVSAAGNVRLVAPREEGSHADRFWACALACHAAAEDVGRVECLTGEPCAAAGLRYV